jgi:hypothetical protein
MQFDELLGNCEPQTEAGAARVRRRILLPESLEDVGHRRLLKVTPTPRPDEPDAPLP